MLGKAGQGRDGMIHWGPFIYYKCSSLLFLYFHVALGHIRKVIKFRQGRFLIGKRALKINFT